MTSIRSVFVFGRKAKLITDAVATQLPKLRAQSANKKVSGCGGCLRIAAIKCATKTALGAPVQCMRSRLKNKKVVQIDAETDARC